MLMNVSLERAFRGLKIERKAVKGTTDEKGHDVLVRYVI